jgi:hypothetical protein
MTLLPDDRSRASGRQTGLNHQAICHDPRRGEVWRKPDYSICVIARSNEAKALGIKMGDAYHLRKREFAEWGVQVFSLRIPTEAGHPFRREAGQRSDLMSATIPR